MKIQRKPRTSTETVETTTSVGAIPTETTNTQEAISSPTPTPTTTPESQKIEVTKDMWNAMLDELKSVREKQAEPKAATGQQEKYIGPVQFRFSLFPKQDESGNEILIPILSMRSIKKDSTRGFVYRNEYGVITDNQLIVVKLADGTEEKVGPFFPASAERSNWKFPTYIVDSKGYKIPGDSDAAREALIRGATHLVFNAIEYGYPEVEISIKCIN